MRSYLYLKYKLNNTSLLIFKLFQSTGHKPFIEYASRAEYDLRQMRLSTKFASSKSKIQRTVDKSIFVKTFEIYRFSLFCVQICKNTREK